MQEIANCPICGCVPNLDILGYEDIPSISHCGAMFESIVEWNRYAAAMELAHRYAESLGPHAEERQAHIAMKDHPDYLKLAQDRVLEVFK
jgi:hypothetical protein